MKILLFIVLICSTASLKAQSTDSLAQDTTIYSESMVTVKPEFAGGNDKLSWFLVNTMRYPAEARENNIHGNVQASFVVEKDGTLSNFKITKGVSRSLDQETIRVLKLSPKWKPAMVNGKPVRMLYSNFHLKYTLAN